MVEVEDAFTIGRKLKEQEKEGRELRITQALAGTFKDKLENNPRAQWEKNERMKLADALYQFRYSGRSYEDNPSAEEILYDLCFNIFGASYTEVLEAWSRFLG